MREQQSKIATEFSTIFQNISEYSRVFKRRLIKLHQRKNNHYFNKQNCSLTMSQSLHFRFAISNSFLSVNFTIFSKTRTRVTEIITILSTNFHCSAVIVLSNLYLDLVPNNVMVSFTEKVLVEISRYLYPVQEQRIFFLGCYTEKQIINR